VRTDRLRLQDILEAIGEVLDTTPGTRAEFEASKLVRSHLARNIQIVGEAANRLSKPLKDQHPEIPWRMIAGMRHVIVHGYYQIDWNEVFDTAKRDIPSLKPLIEALLSSLPDEQP